MLPGLPVCRGDRRSHAARERLARIAHGAPSYRGSACALGYAGACSRLGELYESGRRGSRKVALRISATPGGPPSTIDTRVEDAKTPGIPKDVGRAISAYVRACDMGEHDACFIAARLTRDDGANPEAGLHAFAQFARLCEGGDGPACEAAGALTAGGVSGDDRPAAEWRRMACVFGQATACVAGR